MIHFTYPPTACFIISVSRTNRQLCSGGGDLSDFYFAKEHILTWVSEDWIIDKHYHQPFFGFLYYISPDKRILFWQLKMLLWEIFYISKKQCKGTANQAFSLWKSVKFQFIIAQEVCIPKLHLLYITNGNVLFWSLLWLDRKKKS